MTPRLLSVLVISAVLGAVLVAGCASTPPTTTVVAEDAPTATAEPQDRRADAGRRSRPSDPSQVLRSDLGRLVADSRFFEGTNGLRLVAPDGTIEHLSSPRGCVSGVGAVSPEGDRIAWVTFACPESGTRAPTVLHVRSAAGTHRRVLPTPPGENALTSAVAFRGRAVVVRRASGERLWVDPGPLTPARR